PAGATVGHRAARLDALAEARASGEQIDGGDVLDELVPILAPLEPRRILCARVHDARDAQPHRRQCAGVADVDLHAVAARSLVLVPSGRERAGPEADAGQLFGSERI